MSKIKDRAARMRNLMRDEAFKELMQGVRTEQVGVFLDSNATIEDINQAHDMVKCLEKIERFIQAALDDEAVYDKQNS
jgi:hypothetical protein